MMAMTNTYDEKIMNFNGSFFEDLMALFTDEEITEMRDWLEGEIGYDYGFLEYDDGAGNYKTEEEKRNIIIVDYIRELLCDNIKSGARSSTLHLFNIVYKMF